eukprot:4509735-Lingulodinium_polyedra.AAC.1
MCSLAPEGPEYYQILLSCIDAERVLSDAIVAGEFYQSLCLSLFSCRRAMARSMAKGRRFGKGQG